MDISRSSLESLWNWWVYKTVILVQIVTFSGIFKRCGFNFNFQELIKNLFFQVMEDTDRDFFMSAQEAQQYGLIDKVLEHPIDLAVKSSGIPMYAGELWWRRVKEAQAVVHRHTGTPHRLRVQLKILDKKYRALASEG